MSHAAWWRGTRGEWYVGVQLLLFALVIAGPPTWHGRPGWAFPSSPVITLAGGLLIGCGAGLAIAGVWRFGPTLTALPYPVAHGTLLDTGPYRLVRHPMYSGSVLAAFGWACCRHGWLTFAYAAVLFVFFDIKARREEQWLIEKFPAYADYRRRVRKLVPFVY